MVSGLLDAGAGEDVNVVPTSGRSVSALYLATSRGHQDAARRLVAAGADVHFRDSFEDSSDVLFKAVLAGSWCEELVNDLLEAGASPNKHAWSG